MTSLPVPLVVEMAINRARLTFLGRVLDHALAQIQKRRGQFFQVSLRRFVLELHDFRRVDHRPATQRNDLVRFVEIERLHSLRDDLDLGLRIGNDRDMDVSSRRNVAPDNVYMADLLQSWIGDDDGGARRELAQILHGVHVEIDLIGNSEPHMGLCPPRHALDVEVVIDIYVIGGAVAAAGPASEGKGGHQVVVNAAQRSDRSRRIHDDPPRVDHLAELAG